MPKADAGSEGPAWTDTRIAEALEVDVSTVERLRQLVAWEVVDTVSTETIRRTLKKANASRG